MTNFVRRRARHEKMFFGTGFWLCLEIVALAVGSSIPLFHFLQHSMVFTTTRVKLPTNLRRFRALARAGYRGSRARARRQGGNAARGSCDARKQRVYRRRKRSVTGMRSANSRIQSNKVRAGAKACRPPSRCQPRRRRAAPPQLRNDACATACVRRR